VTVPVAVLETVDARLAETVRAAAGPALDLRFAPTLDAGGFASVLPGARYAVVRGTRMQAGLLDAAPDLVMIHQWGTGIDNVPAAEALARGIVVARSPGRNAPSVADMTLGLMLSVLRRIPAADARMRAGGWKMDALWEGARDLSELRVGLLGFGAIGQAVARRLDGFGATVFYHRPSGPWEERPGWMPLTELVASVDVLSLHLPLTPENRHIIGRREFSRMRRGAVLVNTSRGPLVDEAAMLEALREGWLGGLGLDVFEAEPLPAGHPLLAMPNTVLTPHVAGRTEDNLTRMVRHWAGNIRAHHEGRPLAPEDLVTRA
jgi:phosphoglycerate dehydrogenase-like enzyme